MITSARSSTSPFLLDNALLGSVQLPSVLPVGPCLGWWPRIFGATGIQGWAVTNQLLNGYPSPDSFSKITAVTNRPITEEILWPENDELQVISGINLLTDKGQEGLNHELKERVPDIESVTQVFFFAYVYQQNPDEEISVNVELLKRAVTAVESLSTNLKFVLLPTGTKAYGVQCLTNFPFADKLPLSEDLPRIPEPYRSQNFYYNQTDWLEAESQGKAWTFCEIRPDVVVGFVPNNNVYCLAQTLATYLGCYREIEGEGAECAFLGTAKSWKSLSNDSGQDVVARFAIRAALHPETSGDGQAFNVASHSQPASWEQKWPVICDFFDLKGTPPPEGGSGPQPGEYLASNIQRWKELEKGSRWQPRIPGGLSVFHHDTVRFRPPAGSEQDAYNLEGGEAEESDMKRVWWTAFERFRAAKIIP